MRIQLALSRTVFLGISDLRTSLYGTAPVQAGFVVAQAYKILLSEIDAIDWIKVNVSEKTFLTKHDSEDGVNRTKTTLNIEAASWDGILSLRTNIVDRNIFGTSRIYAPFVIKLIILAATMQLSGDLPLIKKGEEDAQEK